MKNTIKKIAGAIILSGFCFTSFAGNNEDLIAACKKGDLAAAQKTIDAGADVNFKDAQGWTPLGAAFFWPQITQLLIDKKADPNAGNVPPLVNAAGQGSFEVMQILLTAGADPNKPMAVDPSAAYQKLLSDEKAKGKDANKFMIQAYEKLLNDAKSTPPSTLYAIQNLVNRTLCADGLELLIAKGAKTDVLSAATGGNLLDDLASSALPATDWIENNKAQVGGWENMGFKIPDWYKNPDKSKLGSVDRMVKALVKAGVNINAENKIKNTPLLSALGKFSQTKAEVVIAFINNGSDINVESVTLGHPLLQAAGYGFTDVLEALFAKGADMNREFKVDDWIKTGQRLKGITPIMWAAANGKTEAVKYLAGKGAKLNEAAYGTSFNIKTNCLTKVEGKTVLFYAIEGGNADVVKYLVENTSGDWKNPVKIDKMKKTSDMGFQTVTTCFDDGNYTPAKYAKICGMEEIADYLKSKKLN